MAQTGFTPIKLYYSTTASAAPSAGNLASGELAINITDEKLYFKNNAALVAAVELAKEVQKLRDRIEKLESRK